MRTSFVQRLGNVAAAQTMVARAMHAGSFVAQAETARVARSSFAEAAVTVQAQRCADWARQD